MDTSEHHGYKDFVRTVELHQFGMALIGLWPKINDITKNNFASDLRMSITFVIVTFFTLMPLIYSLVRVWGDMILMIDNLQITLPIAVASLKLIIIRWKQSVLSSIMKMIMEDWMKLKNDTERDVMIRRARTARVIIICAYVWLIAGVIVVIVLPSFGIPFRLLTNLTDQNRSLPLPAYYFYDTDKSPQFELTLIAQAVGLFLTGLTYLSVDGLIGLVIFHMCGQLENFRSRIVNLVLCNDFNTVLCHNVEVHSRLIRFADNIEDMFNLMMLGIMLYFGIIICLYGFLLITGFTDNGIINISLSRTCGVIFGAVVIFGGAFLYCCAGEFIIHQCEAVYHAICDLEWYRWEPRNRRTFILLMLRANEPFRITAGKIIPLTLTTYCSLLKTSAGYISFLLAKR